MARERSPVRTAVGCCRRFVRRCYRLGVRPVDRDTLDLARCRVEQIESAGYIMRGEDSPAVRLWLADQFAEELIILGELKPPPALEP